MKDRFNREIDYLRISITDRCNFQCTYCYPPDGRTLLPSDQILSYEEILAVARAGIELGINKFRVTGGEPLVRRDAVWFIEQLLKLPGAKKVALTTNGYLLAEFADELNRVMPHSINIGLNSLKPDTFKTITGVAGADVVWQGIKRLLDLGYQGIKINTVLLRGVNENEISDFVQLAMAYPLSVRFIEYMPCGDWADNRGAVIPGRDIMERIRQRFGEMAPINDGLGSGPARYYRLKGGKGVVGFIMPVSSPFCDQCNRLRLTADGHIKSCLLSNDEIDLKSILRTKSIDRKALIDILKQAIFDKPEKHSASRDNVMSRIGG